ncbi:MAG: selenium metabolism-associated LysR family transcriptional regulator [Eubacteriales bacterium]|nr:selenium metabolism-associated LysR family transcriptional regulator [Eubacteriales bacterium]
MQFKQLEAFLEVVKHKSFTLAAERLFLSQPTISTQISELEKTLGAKLFARSTREVELTPLGEDFANGAAKLLQLRDELLENARNYYSEEGLRGTVRIGASTAPAKHLLPRWLAGMSENYPGLRFVLTEKDSREVIFSLLANEIELGVVGGVYKKRGITYTEICRDRLVFIAPKDAPYLNAQAELKIEAKTKIPFIEREQGSGTRLSTAAFLQGSELQESLSFCAELSSNEAVVEAVAAGLGCAVVAALAAAEAIEQGRVIAVKNMQPEEERSFYLVRRTKGELSPQAKALAEYILSSN